ncbi:MAG: hypothetical protein ACI8YC_000922, partial [Salibacteraceae bacterium]
NLPPGLSAPSKTETEYPFLLKRIDAAMPAMPAPMTTACFLLWEIAR